MRDNDPDRVLAFAEMLLGLSDWFAHRFRYHKSYLTNVLLLSERRKATSNDLTPD